jgi:Fe-S cluster biogenesis protein NfuA
MRVLSIQPTPNPNAYKFFVDGRLGSVARDLSAPPPDADPLTRDLFAVPGVRGLFFLDDFVTVTMAEDADWRAVHEQVTGVLGRHAASPTPAAAAPAGSAPDVDDLGLMAKIEEILNDRVRPALAGDGGGLEVLGLEDKVLRIRYQGACGSCPSSIAGTLMAIQNMLQSEIDESLQVVNA